MKTFIVLAMLIPSISFAGESCKKIMECIEKVSKLTGVNYMYSKADIKGDIEFTSEVELTKENADSLLSEALHMAGFTRVPTQVQGVLKIIKAADARYAGELPKYNASKAVTPEIPQTSDYIHLVYQGHPKGEVGELARNLRPFMSRYGRVIDSGNSQLLIVSDTAAMIRSMLPIIQQMDVPLSAEFLKRQEQFREHGGPRPPRGQQDDMPGPRPPHQKGKPQKTEGQADFAVPRN